MVLRFFIHPNFFYIFWDTVKAAKVKIKEISHVRKFLWNLSSSTDIIGSRNSSQSIGCSINLIIDARAQTGKSIIDGTAERT